MFVGEWQQWLLGALLLVMTVERIDLYFRIYYFVPFVVMPLARSLVDAHHMTHRIRSPVTKSNLFLMPPCPTSQTDTCTTPDNPSTFYPTEDDFLAVRADLLKFVPLELVQLFLTTAQYWPRICTKRSVQSFIRATALTNFEGETCYLVSDPVPALAISPDSDRKRKIEMIRFVTESHDQGWTSDPEPQGGSW
jgi:hypothetical protein